MSTFHRQGSTMLQQQIPPALQTYVKRYRWPCVKTQTVYVQIAGHPLEHKHKHSSFATSCKQYFFPQCLISLRRLTVVGCRQDGQTIACANAPGRSHSIVLVNCLHLLHLVNAEDETSGEVIYWVSIPATEPIAMQLRRQSWRPGASECIILALPTTYPHIGSR